ncbi:MAG: hypothetical protein JXB49_26670, partial [Bacteroidales bacterium]|nr:hypothetical protein [Bacteroidales bacterium]
TEAVSRIIQNLENNKPTNYKTAYYKKLEIVFQQISVLFKLNKPDSVKKYLSDRGINYSDLEDVFHIGTPVLYGRLSDHFIFVKSIDDKHEQILNDLYIERRPSNYYYLSYDLSVVVPVYDKNKDFLGFHGRRINPGSRSKYFNTGFLRESIDETLYGEHLQNIIDAINNKKQVILTKGIFDLFVCYQSDHKQTLSTLNQGLFPIQFKSLLSMPVEEIIVGHEQPLQREIIIALISSNLKKIDVLIPQTVTDIDNTVVNTGVTVSDIIKNALKTAKYNEESKIKAMVRQRNYSERTLTEYGKTFLVESAELEKMLLSNKVTVKGLKSYIQSKCHENRQTVPKGERYIRIASTFATDAVLDDFGPEIRLLLYLLIKASPRTRIFNFTNKILANDLKICETTLIKHRKLLKEKGYLLTIKVITTHTRKKGRIERKVHDDYYPSTIPYSLGD